MNGESGGQNLEALAAMRNSAGPQPGEQPQAQAQPQQAEQPGAMAKDEELMGKVASSMQQMGQAAQQMIRIDPRITTIVVDSLDKLYLTLAKFYGVEEEVKLARKKGQQRPM